MQFTQFFSEHYPQTSGYISIYESQERNCFPDFLTVAPEFPIRALHPSTQKTPDGSLRPALENCACFYFTAPDSLSHTALQRFLLKAMP